MKRVLSMLLVLALLASMIPAAAADDFEKSQTWSDARFTDVSAGDWFYETVRNTYELGLMSGYGNGRFMPKGSITLAETIAVAARIHAIYTGGSAAFVQGSPWYQVYVDYALVHGIVTAEPENHRKPATRREFAEILSRALPEEALPAINTVDDGAIPDVADNDAIYLLYRAGVLTGSDAEGTFYPASNITRSAAAAIIARMALPELREEITLTAGTKEIPRPTISERPQAAMPDGEPSGEPENRPAVQEPESALDEDNALTKPFDLVYPDLFASGSVSYSTDRILIKLEQVPTADQQQALAQAGVAGLELFMNLDVSKWYAAQVDGSVMEVMSRVRALDFVKVAEYNFAYETDTIIECQPDDLHKDVHGNANLGEQWYLRCCGIKKGWDHLRRSGRPNHNTGSSGETTEPLGAGEDIVVAVIDTGVDYTHQDLKSNIWVNLNETPNDGVDNDGNGYVDDYYGYNAVAGSGSAMDDQGHGTHVAGIIAASNNNMGTVGIAYNARIMPIKAGTGSGYFNQDTIAQAIIYACKNGADVINMSFGGSASSIAVQEALAYAYSSCVLVASAGNDGVPNENIGVNEGMPTYPAALSYVLGVMSVDESGRESSFTNYDVTGFNTVEYEVYAPGSAMISTIPGNRYATWSGTSMAAPVVSAIAALLRDEYRDTETYPTEFIYGQICGTGTEAAACLDEAAHGDHDMPKIVDVYAAMTELPEPELGVTDMTLFDTVGLNGSTVNNGDGVIDAGETIAIGFTLRNRWGMSENTVVTVDARSQSGVADSYVTIHTVGANYGSVGTYSTQDAGKVYEDGVFVGWENPIYITIDEDCPNDYFLTLHVTVTCGNGLDSADTNTYTAAASYDFTVRRGHVLDKVISEDMTLTADDYYIIPNGMLVAEGATLTVEAGAQIQFWSDDPNYAYADTAIAVLNVEGTLLCNGTSEKPVKLFPSESMSEYQVQLAAKNYGVIRLYHTEVTNPHLEDVTYAENCTFTQNNRNASLKYRYLSGTAVRTGTHAGLVRVRAARDCAFYGLGPNVTASGDYEGCIFADCAMALSGGSFENCVFYGNNNYMGQSGSVSTLTAGNSGGVGGPCTVYTDSSTGTVYIRYYGSVGGELEAEDAFARYLGGHLAYIETETELDFLKGKIPYPEMHIGLTRDAATGKAVWLDGSEAGDFLNVTGTGYLGVFNGSTDTVWLGGGSMYYLMELSQTAVEKLVGAGNTITLAQLQQLREEYTVNAPDPGFHGNYILNRLCDDNVNNWLRVQGSNSASYKASSISGNYWGTTNEVLIGKQLLDWDFVPSLVDLQPGEVLTEISADAWPVVTKAGLLNAGGEEVTSIGNETVTFYVEFNRPMDTSIPLDVRFGSSWPYTDYVVDGAYVSATRWEGSTTLVTLIEAGYQYWSISNGQSADDEPLKLYPDRGRFTFEIDTTSALALTMFAEARDDGVQLTWTQDDFDTLAGYNVYRADGDENAYYQKLNSSVIPADTREFFDDTVLPGQEYYYRFHVVKTDLSESEPSGKVRVLSKDTEAPNLYHTPVYQAYVGSNVVIDTVVTDNLAVTQVQLHYCVGGTWTTVNMDRLNDSYSAVISGNKVTSDGISYYISATDGVSTIYKGSQSSPYEITVQEKPDTMELGDVDGSGRITVLDALMVLRAINNKINLGLEQFERADLNGDGKLSAAEALVILKYANGEIGSVQM